MLHVTAMIWSSSDALRTQRNPGLVCRGATAGIFLTVVRVIVGQTVDSDKSVDKKLAAFREKNGGKCDMGHTV